MDAKYVGLLCRVKDRAIRDILTEMLKEMEREKQQQNPLSKLGHSAEMLGKYRQAQGQ